MTQYQNMLSGSYSGNLENQLNEFNLKLQEAENEQNKPSVTASEAASAATKAGESVTGTRDKDGSFGGPYVLINTVVINS